MKKIILIIFVLSFFVVSCIPSGQQISEPSIEPPRQSDITEAPPTIKEVDEHSSQPSLVKEQQQPQQTPTPTLSWKLGKVAIAGKYADADIVDLGNGEYRMYYSEEPEVPNFKGRVYSALSPDGINWQQENGVRKEWAIFPSVIKLSDGRYRMYFQNEGVIKSAISNDGLLWKDEPGTRVDASNNAGLKLNNVAAPTVMKIADAYIMVYAGAINEKYPEKVPNNEIHLFLWATSADGLSFEKKGIALDSRNNEFKGWIDGTEFIEWDDNSIRLYFWSYKGIYYVLYKGGNFSEDAVFDYTTNDNPLNQFPENPPGDPTLAKINGQWFLFYGQHTKGIYYAVMKET